MRCDRHESSSAAQGLPQFQSLSGFLMRCDGHNYRRGSPETDSFQSLSGFLMRCDSVVVPASVAIFEFQSLSGFLMRCDQPDPGMQRPVLQRFNPYRVF